MTPTAACLGRDEMEQRRLAAAEALASGVSQAATARRFGVSRTSVWRWNKLQKAGAESLRRRHATGRPSRLFHKDYPLLRTMYESQPDHWWTGALLAQEIYRRFGFWYHEDHAGRLLRRLRNGEWK